MRGVERSRFDSSRCFSASRSARADQCRLREDPSTSRRMHVSRAAAQTCQALFRSSPICVQRLNGHKVRKVSRGSNGMDGRPFQFQQQHAFIAHAAGAAEDGFNCGVDRFDDTEADGMVTVSPVPSGIAFARPGRRAARPPNSGPRRRPGNYLKSLYSKSVNSLFITPTPPNPMPRRGVKLMAGGADGSHSSRSRCGGVDVSDSGHPIQALAGSSRERPSASM